MRVNLEARAANAEQRRARTRLRLLEAALAVIAEKGPDQASVEDFVAAAGVSRGTFYNYFPTVDELLEALNGHLAETFDAEIARITEGVRDPALGLALLIHATFHIVTHDPMRGWVALRIFGTSAPRHKLLANRFDAIFAWAVERGRFRPAVADAARNLLFGAVRMAQAEVLSKRSDLDHVVDLVRLILTAYGLDPVEADELSREAQARCRNELHYSPVM